MQSLDKETYSAVYQLNEHASSLPIIRDKIDVFPTRAHLIANRYRTATQLLNTEATNLYLALFDGFAEDGKELLMSDRSLNVSVSLRSLRDVLEQKAHMAPEQRTLLEAMLTGQTDDLHERLKNGAFDKLEDLKRTLSYGSTGWIGQLEHQYSSASALERVIDFEAKPLPIIPDM